MIYVFWIVATIGLFYFVIKVRLFDFFSIAFFSGMLYFMPGFVGYVTEFNTPYSPYVKRPDKIVDEAYLIMIFVQGSILFSAIIYDFFFQKKKLILV